MTTDAKRETLPETSERKSEQSGTEPHRRQRDAAPGAPNPGGLSGLCCEKGPDLGCSWHDAWHLARITPHRAALLDHVASFESNVEIGAAFGIACSTTAHEIEQLRELTGCASKAELACWWLVHRQTWRDRLAQS